MNENLNKANFFDKMSKLYPVAMKDFHKWIDAYKASVDWEKLFPNYSFYRGFNYSDETKVKGAKFHDIPYEMQLGILLRYACEVFPGEKESFIELPEMKVLFESYFQALEASLKPDVTDVQEKDLKDIKRHGAANNG